MCILHIYCIVLAQQPCHHTWRLRIRRHLERQTSGFEKGRKVTSSVYPWTTLVPYTRLFLLILLYQTVGLVDGSYILHQFCAEAIRWLLSIYLLLLLILIECVAVASPLGEHDDDALLLVAFGRSTTYDDAISSWILIHTFSIVIYAHAAHNRGIYMCCPSFFSFLWITVEMQLIHICTFIVFLWAPWKDWDDRDSP
jgi:hypothetical protein